MLHVRRHWFAPDRYRREAAGVLSWHEGDFASSSPASGHRKRPFLQALGADPQPASIPEQQFSADCAARWKTERHARSAGRTTAGRGPDRRVLQIPSHVRRSGGKIDARGWPDAEHDQASSTAMSCRNVLASNPGFTSTRSPPDRSTVISPPPRGRATFHQSGQTSGVCVVRCSGPSAFDSESDSDPASSRADPFADRTLSDSSSARLQLLNG